MVTAKLDPQVLAHLEWLGFIQPTGLVVSAAALVSAGAILDRRDARGQELLRASLEDHQPDGDGTEPVAAIGDFRRFAETVLDWTFRESGYAGMNGHPIPAELEVLLPEFGETLRPDLAVRELDPAAGEAAWQLVVCELPLGQDLDAIPHTVGGFEASPHGRMERLLRETGVSAGLLCNGLTLRLVSAPRGETSGWLDFRVEQMVETAGRPLSTALRLLLNERRLLALPEEKRLAALLHQSRLYQNTVSEQLAQQVLHALYELLRGVQAADDSTGGDLLRGPLEEDPDQVYHALLTVILRLVFVLYAEERGMLPGDETFLRSYSLAGLYERLREDAVQHPDTLDQRFGGWAQLLALFRMVHDGAAVGYERMPARRGVLFDPDRFPFLEGRVDHGQVGERIEPPRIPDGTVYRALEKLLVLDGERISYRALDVEQIGSVYETMMGFRLELAAGPSVALRSPKSHGAPTALNLQGLLDEESSKRSKYVKDRTDRKLSPKMSAAIKSAASVGDLHAALEQAIDSEATPDLVPAGAMVLQPSQARRRSGSHYTPRSLTEPIVRTTLEPVLRRMRGEDGSQPTPDQILDLKVCDPAMGSGAFLVEACRQLGDALVEAWVAHGRPEIPPDEDEVVFARRLVAQRCLYGVDRNPVAVDLAKMSLWLATLAREHALTFVDHALRHGDSLVGLGRDQIGRFRWDGKAGDGFEAIRIRTHLDRVSAIRERIREAGEGVSDSQLRDLWNQAQEELSTVRLFGDLAVLAFFSGAKPREREAKRDEFAHAIATGDGQELRGLVDEAREAELALAPFHWEAEFPEVFERENPGFDAMVGNPPFGGKNSVAAGNPPPYSDWLKGTHEESHGNSDLVAHFFRRSFDLLRRDGTLGLIATNTIGQGDTRSTGLRWILTHGGEIFEARRRLRWPGQAAVVVSVVHIAKGAPWRTPRLDDCEVERISAFLFHRGGDEDPIKLAANQAKSFQGAIVLGMGFTFDDTDTKGVASPLEEMRRLVEMDPANAEAIAPYIGGEEVNTSPLQEHHRYVIDFGERDEEECRRRWPELMAIVEEKVRPERLAQNDKGAKEKWWQYIRPRPELKAAISGLQECIVTNCGATPHLAVSFQSSAQVFANTLAVFAFDDHATFCALQSRPHEVWARFFASSMKDDLRYTPSDCFETFPFPDRPEMDRALGEAGRSYYQHRAELMTGNDEGLTKTYNRFHDPEETDPGILRLRELHADMDRVVLSAYDWADIPTECEFILDYDEGEESSKRKKPWRYRWPDEVRDEVLARLIELNDKRSAEEKIAPGPRPASKASLKPKQEDVLF
jgi:hypothetical protein